jgi:hypothetical protein
MAGEGKRMYDYEKCGCESELVIEEKSEEKPKEVTLVCKVHGNEADMILEEI